MRPIAIILIVIAIASAALTAFLAKSWLNDQSARKAAVTAVVERLDVLVVARDVPAGTTLAETDLRYEPWPASVISDRFVTRKPGEDTKAQYVGQPARRFLAEGEPFAPASVFRPDNSGLLAGVLSAGMRAVSVAITNASAVSGFVVPGDRVDVVLAADFQRTDSDSVGKGSAIVRYAAETVLEDVKILAIDQQLARAKDGAAIQGKTATLEVSPKQAEILTAAGMLGQLSLVLRGTSKDDGSMPKGQAYTADIEASKAMRAMVGESNKPKAASHGGGGVRVNRAGDVSTKGF